MAEAMLNIGYLIGKSKKRLHTRRIHNAVKKTGVKIIKSEMRKEDPNNKYDEDTRVIKIDRPLTKKEMIELCTSLGQIAIPQMSGETGTLWGPKQVLIDRNYDGGKFNIDYFKLFSSEDEESFDAEGEYICPHCSNELYRLDLTEKYTCPDCEGLIYEDFRDGDGDPADFMAESFESDTLSAKEYVKLAKNIDNPYERDDWNDLYVEGYIDCLVDNELTDDFFDAESKCACGCSIGKCGCPEGCKCGCNHKKGGAKWAQAESFEAEGGCVHHNYPMAGTPDLSFDNDGSVWYEIVCGNCGATAEGAFYPEEWGEEMYAWNDAESFEANWGGMSNMPGHPLNPSRPSDDRGDRLKPRRPIRRPRRRPYNAEVFGQDIDNKTIGIVALAAIIGGWLFNRGKD